MDHIGNTKEAKKIFGTNSSNREELSFCKGTFDKCNVGNENIYRSLYNENKDCNDFQITTRTKYVDIMNHSDIGINLDHLFHYHDIIYDGLGSEMN